MILGTRSCSGGHDKRAGQPGNATAERSGCHLRRCQHQLVGLPVEQHHYSSLHDPTHLPIFLTDEVCCTRAKTYSTAALSGSTAPATVPGNGGGSNNSNGNAVGADLRLGLLCHAGHLALNPNTDWALQDIHALSHEIAEWADDPFINNTVQPWLTPTAPQYGCTGILETGDPVVGIGFSKGTNTFRQGPDPNGVQIADGYISPRGRSVLAVVHADRPERGLRAHAEPVHRTSAATRSWATSTRSRASVSPLPDARYARLSPSPIGGRPLRAAAGFGTAARTNRSAWRGLRLRSRTATPRTRSSSCPLLHFQSGRHAAPVPSWQTSTAQRGPALLARARWRGRRRWDRPAPPRRAMTAGRRPAGAAVSGPEAASDPPAAAAPRRRLRRPDDPAPPAHPRWRRTGCRQLSGRSSP